MNRTFHSGWECWFVDDFGPEAPRKSLTMIKDFCSSPVIAFLKISPAVHFIGPGATLFDDAGMLSPPVNFDPCHVLAIMDGCPQELAEKAETAARSAGVPVMKNPVVGQLLECYFIPSAWERLREPPTALASE